MLGGLRRECTGTFNSGDVVTLTAAADAGKTFAGWGGACSGTGACTLTLAQSMLVVATFSVPPPVVTQYYHLDVLGSVRAVTDAQGALVRRHDYAVFGEDLAEHEVQTLPALAKQQRFAGKERDFETSSTTPARGTTATSGAGSRRPTLTMSAVTFSIRKAGTPTRTHATIRSVSSIRRALTT